MKKPAASFQQVTHIELDFPLEEFFEVDVYSWLAFRRYVGGTDSFSGQLYIGGAPHPDDEQAVGFLKFYGHGMSQTIYVNNVNDVYPTPTTRPWLNVSFVSVVGDLLFVPTAVDVGITAPHGVIHIPDHPEEAVTLDDNSGFYFYAPSIMIEFLRPSTPKGGGVRGAKWLNFDENIYNIHAER